MEKSKTHITRLGILKKFPVNLSEGEISIEVMGDSMFLRYPAGSHVICKKVSDTSIILYGEVYLVVTEDYKIVKRIRRGEDKTRLLLCSDNEELTGEGKLKYESFTIPVSKIKELYLVKGKMERSSI